MILTTLRPSVTDLESGSGWELKPEGACRGDVCVPLPAGVVAADHTVDAAAFAARMGMPLVTDAPTGLSSLGPSSISGHALVTTEAPELVLPDLDGNDFRLSSLRGRKVVLVSWAPY